MLLQFSVENFLSFRERATLNMLAADHIQHRKNQFLEGPGGRHVLRAAAIYGANASGKSNLVKALAFALRFIRKGYSADSKLERFPFKLSAHTRQSPSSFAFEIDVDGTLYSYSFEFDDKRILGEWLYFYPFGNEELIFQRKCSRPEQSESSDQFGDFFEFGNKFIAPPERRSFVRFVSQGTRPNQLFLTAAKEHNVVEFSPFYNALGRINSISPNARFGRIFDLLPSSSAFRDFINESLRNAGTGLEGITIESKELEISADDLPARELAADVDENQERYLLFGEGTLAKRIADNKLRLFRLLGIHKDSNHQDVHLTMAEESDGTRRMIHVWPALYLMQVSALVSVFDELERSLHPLLTKTFLEEFFRIGNQNPSGQLIFTTHDANLLDLNLLSHDSVWFTEKNKEGATTLYSLAEFNNEQLSALSAHLKDGYLQGRFGAIPFLANIERLGLSPTKEG